MWITRHVIHLNCTVTAFTAVFHPNYLNLQKVGHDYCHLQWQCTRSCVTYLMQESLYQWKEDAVALSLTVNAVIFAWLNFRDLAAQKHISRVVKFALSRYSLVILVLQIFLRVFEFSLAEFERLYAKINVPQIFPLLQYDATYKFSNGYWLLEQWAFEYGLPFFWYALYVVHLSYMYCYIKCTVDEHVRECVYSRWICVCVCVAYNVYVHGNVYDYLCMYGTSVY